MPRQELATIRDDLQRMQPEFAKVLPSHIPPDRYVRVVTTAVQRNPDLLECSRRSLMLACQQCAEDGLYPDGKQAILLPMKSKQGQPSVAYIPMVAGIKMKIREGGDVADITCELVHAGDVFHFVKGDQPRIVHEPCDAPPTAPITHVYSIVKYRNGSISRNVMTWGEVIAIRDRYARAKSGPWFDPISIGEMAKKTCLKRHAKMLDTSPETEQVLDRDNVLYDLDQKPELSVVTTATPPKRTVQQALDTFADIPDEPAQALQFNTLEDYARFISDSIKNADAQADIDNIKVFWAETKDQRMRLGMAPQTERVLGQHIDQLTLPGDANDRTGDDRDQGQAERPA